MVEIRKHRSEKECEAPGLVKVGANNGLLEKLRGKSHPMQVSLSEWKQFPAHLTQSVIAKLREENRNGSGNTVIIS